MQKSWPLITLYYYASTRDREFFSSGDKCLAQGGPTMPPVENKEQKIVDVSIFHRRMAGALGVIG